MRMAATGSIMAGIAVIVLAFSACGPAEDGTEISVRTSETDDADTVLVHTPPDTVTNTIVEQRTDTVVEEGVVVQKRTDTVVEVVPGKVVVSDAEKRDIDAWLTANRDKLNEFGDPKDMVYTGGTPLFNEATGKTMTKYEYIISQHPDRPWLR